MRNEDEPRRFEERMQARQQNLLWPDFLKNAAGVDSFILKGSPKATPVQRAGIFVFAVVFLCFAALFVYIGVRGIRIAAWGFVPLAMGVLLGGLGFKLLSNSFRR